MTKFIQMDDKGNTISERDVKQSDMLKCPHVIIMEEHYREDGTCKCNDPEHVVMLEWGYVWDGAQWVSEEEEE